MHNRQCAFREFMRQRRHLWARRLHKSGRREEEQADFNAHPSAAMELLKIIPRLESTSWIIGQQLKRDIPEAESPFPPLSAIELVRAAKVLKLAVAFEQLRKKFPAKVRPKRAFESEVRSSAWPDRHPFGPPTP